MISLVLILAITTLYLTIKLYHWTFNKKMIDEIPGKYVLITGCDSGFGKRLTEKLLNLGVNVFAGCFTEMGKESLEIEFGNLPGKLTTMKLDITNQKNIDDCYNFVVKILKQQVS